MRHSSSVYRILYHHRTQDPDGQRVHIHEIQDALRRAGHKVFEVSPVGTAEAAGEPCLPTWNRRLLGGLAQWSPKGIYELLELSYNVFGYIQLARAIRRHRPHFIYERYSLHTAAGVWAAGRAGIPLLLEVNSPLAEEKRRNDQLLFFRMSRACERYVFRRATRLLAVTAVLGKEIAAGSGASEGRIQVIPNGVRPERFDHLEHERRATRDSLGCGRKILVGAVGFFREWHGIDRLLECLRDDEELRRRSRLLLVGEGPAIPQLREAAECWGISSLVYLTGSVPHGEVPRYIAAADIVVLPRAVEYASPLKLLEYMAAGKAILAPRQDNLQEILTHDENALLVHPENLHDLRRALHRLIHDQPLRRRLGETARSTIQRRGLTWDCNAERIVKVYEAIARERESAILLER